MVQHNGTSFITITGITGCCVCAHHLYRALSWFTLPHAVTVIIGPVYY